MDIPQINPLTAPDQLRAAVHGTIDVESYMVRQDGAVTIDGQLKGDARIAFRALRQRIEGIGFTPFLGRTETGVRLTAVPGVIQHKPARVRINIILFLLTVVTVLWTGALQEVEIAALPAATSATQQSIEYLRLLFGVFSIPPNSHSGYPSP